MPPAGSREAYRTNQNGISNTNHKRGIFTNDMPRRLSWSAAQPRCPSRRPILPTLDESPKQSPLTAKHMSGWVYYSKSSIVTLFCHMGTQKVNINHAFLPFHFLNWRIGVREPWADVGHDGKFSKFPENPFPGSNSWAASRANGSILTNDGRCTCEIKSTNAMAKAAFNKKKTLFTSKLDLNLRKKLVKC